jgi:hypothetical protein
MQQAGILCNDPRFHKFAAAQSGAPTEHLTKTAATEYLRNFCSIQSRRDLSANQTACGKFQTLRTEFDAWLGKIPRPNEAHQ